MARRFNRRQFLARSTAATGGVAVIGTMVLPAWAESPNEKLDIAVNGVARRGAANLKDVKDENIVALCDVDGNNLAKAAASFPKAKAYRDFRNMLTDMETKIDAVVVSTPDHTHAPIGAMALKMGKHLYCEKPLTHCVHETRLMTDLARENKLTTQLGTQIHAIRADGLLASSALVHHHSSSDSSSGSPNTGSCLVLRKLRDPMGL